MRKRVQEIFLPPRRQERKEKSFYTSPRTWRPLRLCGNHLLLAVQVAFYTDKILEHARRPRKFGRVIDPDVRFEELNPLCGDRIRVELRLVNGSQILEARFSGEMCAIAKGAASILFESLEGRMVAAIVAITDGEILESLAGAIPKNRIQCALLPISALRGAVRNEGRDRPSK